MEHALVVHGSGMDEISTLDKTYVAELREGEIQEYTILPEDFGIKKPKLEKLYAKDINTCTKFFIEVLEGKAGERQDIVLLNAAAGIFVGGVASSLKEGLEIARETVESGKAISKFERLKKETHET
jgi:anthranilate phosphoribosyltransferase